MINLYRMIAFFAEQVASREDEIARLTARNAELQERIDTLEADKNPKPTK